MRSVLKRDAAVSPVLATVLLVALTVVVVAVSAGVVMEIAGGTGGAKSVDIRVSPAEENTYEVVVTGGADAGSLQLLTGVMESVAFEEGGTIASPKVGLPDHLKVSGAAITGEKLLTLVGTFADGTVQMVYQAQVNVVAGGALPTPPVTYTWTPLPTQPPVKPTPTNPTPVPTVTLTPVPTGDPEFQNNDGFWYDDENDEDEDDGINLKPYAVNNKTLYVSVPDDGIKVAFRSQKGGTGESNLTVSIYDENGIFLKKYDNSSKQLDKGTLKVWVAESELKVKIGYTIVVELNVDRTSAVHNIEAYVTIRIVKKQND